MDWRHDSFNDETLVASVAHAERWQAHERQRFSTLRDEITGTDGVDEAFLIVRSGGEPLVERVVAVGSWPLWCSAPVGHSDTPILDGLAELATTLRKRPI